MTEKIALAAAIPDAELQRTQRSDDPPSEFFWEQDTFRRIGHESLDMTQELSQLPPTLRDSFKHAALDFAKKGDYSAGALIHLMVSLRLALKNSPSNHFDTTWTANSLKLPAFANSIGSIRNFFTYWKAFDPQAISDEALQLLVKAKPRSRNSRNVLSDNPELSWLTDGEYDALVVQVWRNYDNGVISTRDTLLLLMSMQYARRPVQFAHLKIGDFQIAEPGDNSVLSGPVVRFPGVKDLTAEKGFRDSKVETQPLPDHLWNLFEVQREEVRALSAANLDLQLSNKQLEKLPVFTTARRLLQAVANLTNHYRVDWQEHLDHELFHLRPEVISDVLCWTPGGHRRQTWTLPISERTGRPIVVNATRLRHTRARQLARKGVPRHVLSHWLGHTSEKSLDAYYNDPAEDARQINEAMAPALTPLAMAFAGKLLDSEDQASRRDDPTSRLEFAVDGKLKSVGNCGKHSFCATTSVPIPCYRCKHFEPLVTAPHHEVIEALKIRQVEENRALRIGGARNLLVPIDLSADIRAVQNCIDCCSARKAELEIA